MLAFFRGSWRQNNCLAFSFQYLAFFEGSWHILSDLCFGFLNIMLRSVGRLFWTVLGVFSQRLSSKSQKNKVVA